MSHLVLFLLRLLIDLLLIHIHISLGSIVLLLLINCSILDDFLLFMHDLIIYLLW